MTLPTSNVPPPGATTYEQDLPGSSARLHKGRCSLAFEGQSFVPAGADQRAYWLVINDGTLKRLIELLEATGSRSELEVFQIEFWGTLSWVGGGNRTRC